MTTWNEATPVGTDYISGGDDNIRDLKAAVRERLAREHYMLGAGDSSDDGKHRMARGVAADRPTAVAGHIYISTDTQKLSFAIADGTWVDLRADDPAGVIKLFAGADAPSGWLICNGNLISRTTYADLFAVIGTTYGVGDGSTTFSLPDLKGRVPVGLDSSQSDFDALGEIGGEKTHALVEAELAAHNHDITDPGHTHAPLNGGNFVVNRSGASYMPVGVDNNMTYDITTGSRTTGITVNDAGSGTAHNNLQPYIALNYIIKY